MRKLDSARIKTFLSPWMEEMTANYSALSSPIVQSVVISAVEAGASVDSLKGSLAPYFPRHKDLKKFIYRLSRALDNFARAGTSSVSARRAHSPPRYSRHREDDRAQRDSTRDNTGQREVTISNATQKEAQPAAVSPFFVSSEAMILSKGTRKVKPLLLNEKGEKIDEDGNVVKTEFVVNSNIRHTTKVPRAQKPRPREFRFFEPGVLTAQAEAKRHAMEIDASIINGFPLFDVIALERDVETPDIDWWDLPFVILDEHQKPTTDEDGNWTPNLETVTNDYENAAPVPVPQPKVREMPTILTEKERKKIRHITRLEKRNQEHLMIKLNLKEKETPRIKDSQMINFAGGKAVLHPTEVAMAIQKAKEERQRKHQEHNEGRKLTKEQRSEKNAEKRKNDSENNLTITVYAMRRITNPLHFAKLTRMAEKWFITGGVFLVKSPEIAFVVVESGPKATRKYSALVERRIDWNVQEDGSTTENQWTISYQGPEFKRHFYNFKKYVFDVGTQCRAFFKKAGAEEMFDSAARAFL